MSAGDARGGTTQATHPGVFTLAVWFGLLTGYTTLAVLAQAKLVRHRFLHASPDLPWATPLSSVFLFLGLGTLLWLGGRVSSRLTTGAVRIGSFTALAVLSILYQPVGLHRGAAALLAVGIGWRAATLFKRHEVRLVPVIRRTLPVFLLIFLLLGGGTFARRMRAEQQALAGLVAAPSGAPNVLFLVLDTVRAASLSLYGYSKPTSPELTRLAATGVRFDEAFSTAPWTLPSHASLMTGQWAHILSADWTRPLDTTYSTLAEFFASEGYATAGFAANTWYCGVESGLARGFSHYEEEPVAFWPILRSTAIGKALSNAQWLRRAVGSYHKFGRKNAPEMNAALLGWLERHHDRPTFTFVNYFDAHGPYDPPAPYDSLFGARTPRNNPDLKPSSTWDPGEIAAQQRAYDASIAYLDHMLGRLLADLRARGMLENTIIVLTADHGEEFHEHGVMEHGNSLYRSAVHVPLLLVWPGHLPSGPVVEAPVSLREVAHTIAALAAPVAANPFPGRSLTRFLDPHADGTTGANDTLLIAVSYASGLPASYPVSVGPLRSAVHDDLRLIVNAAGREELYDQRTDPGERHNLTGDPAAAPLLVELRAQLAGMPIHDR